MFDEMISSYIEDLRSNLLLLNESLIRIQNGQHGTDVINEVFRVAHTIKGNSAAMEFTRIEKVMHTMEDVLQEVRSGQRELSLEIIDVLFASHDFLEDCLDIISSNHNDEAVDLTVILEKIRRVEENDSSAEVQPVISRNPSVPETQLPQVAEEDAAAKADKSDFPFEIGYDSEPWQKIRLNLDQGLPVYWIKILLDEQCQMKAVRTWLVLEKISHHAEIVASLPERSEGESFAEDDFDFDGFLLQVLLIAERDIEDLLDDLRRTIDVVEVTQIEMQQNDFSGYLQPESDKQIAERLLQDIGIALLKCEQNGSDDTTLSYLIQLLNQTGGLEINGISQVFPAAVDGVLTALQEMKDREELPGIQDLLSLSYICDLLTEGLRNPEYTFQLSFTNELEEKLFELRHDAQNVVVGEILKRRGVLTDTDIEDIFEKQKSPQYQEVRFGEIAIREKKIPPHEIISALQAQKSATPPRPREPEVQQTAQRAATESSFIRVPVIKVEGLMDMLSELLILNSQSEQLAGNSASKDAQMMSTLSQTAKLIREIQNLSMSLRLVEIRPTLHRLTRIARDTAAELNKRVTINIEGEETEIDRSAAEKLFDPLMHLVRNAVSHGVEENVADRIKLGKKTEGQITVRAYSRQGSVFIDVADDGQGIDTEKVLNKARRMGLVDEHTEYTAEEINRFIFLPGFSTQEQVNNISGRGVGMNVVEEEMRRLGGKVDVTTKRGEGSVFTLRIPMNLAVVNGTIVEISGERFIIPTLFIREFAMRQSYKWVSMQGRKRAIQIRNEGVIPILEPSSVFGYGYDTPDGDSRNELVIMELESKQLAFPVDRILARQEIVSKPLDNEFARIDFVSGASILGDGQVSLILDVEAMFKAAGL